MKSIDIVFVAAIASVIGMIVFVGNNASDYVKRCEQVGGKVVKSPSTGYACIDKRAFKELNRD